MWMVIFWDNNRFLALVVCLHVCLLQMQTWLNCNILLCCATRLVMTEWSSWLPSKWRLCCGLCILISFISSTRLTSLHRVSNSPATTWTPLAISLDYFMFRRLMKTLIFLLLFMLNITNSSFSMNLFGHSRGRRISRSARLCYFAVWSKSHSLSNIYCWAPTPKGKWKAGWSQCHALNQIRLYCSYWGYAFHIIFCMRTILLSVTITFLAPISNNFVIARDTE